MKSIFQIATVADKSASQFLSTHKFGAVETAPQFIQVLRTHPSHPESDLSDFHALRRDFNPRRTPLAACID